MRNKTTMPSSVTRTATAVMLPTSMKSLKMMKNWMKNKKMMIKNKLRVSYVK